MTEEQARQWVDNRYPASRVAQLEKFIDRLVVENDRQNLVAPSTIASVWSRHIVDSAQLLDLAPAVWHHWVDIGSGAGLPGLVVAALSGKPVTLIEPRRLRTEFLARCCDDLGLELVAIVQGRAETAQVSQSVDVISARAVAKLPAIFAASRDFASPSTTYILPKGESAHSEVAVAQTSWQGTFHVEQSIVDPNSGIVVATDVRPR